MAPGLRLEALPVGEKEQSMKQRPTGLIALLLSVPW